MATQLLAKASVDVEALNKKYSVRVEQQTLEVKRRKRDLPIFYVKWGENEWRIGQKVMSTPAVQVDILGTTKKLLQLTLADNSFVQRPLLMITNGTELV